MVMLSTMTQIWSFVYEYLRKCKPIALLEKRGYHLLVLEDKNVIYCNLLLGILSYSAIFVMISDVTESRRTNNFYFV
jgi:hypothetical protein